MSTIDHDPTVEREPYSLQSPIEADPGIEQTLISFLGGMGYDREKHQTALNYFHSLGRTTLSAMPDPDMNSYPKGYRVVSTETGTKVMSRPFAYLETAKPDVVLIASRQQEARADELIEHIEHETSEPVTHIAQSADAQNAVLAAHKRPDLFKNLVLMFPSGMVKKQSRTEYLRQIASSVREEKSEKDMIPPENDYEAMIRPTSIRERVKSGRFKKSGGYPVAASAIAAYNSHLLHETRQKENTPGVAMVLGLKDKMMRPDRIIQSLVSASDVDYILVTNTSHGINGRKDLATEVIQLSDMMDARNARRNTAHTQGETLEPESLAQRLLFMPDVPEDQREKLRLLADAVPLVA